ncbi:aminoglycoside phosphotransferase family protein [Pseudohaliea rubra]|uniref:Putative phosphotransferase n=1 Tax=Pseudohaliea rubra DSM 19751 TaxID=1265313 RepID=A0A095WW29_9GAMM|nr:phosphotransferase [Pseudohaliea rubra]KGE02859.1 putative phosphotransferase [Pseudohaliea rubra DSM 19751]
MSGAPADLLPWCLAQLPDPAGAALAPLAGDASFRRYFRLRWTGGTAVACVAPPATEKNAEFLAVREQFAAAGVRVPGLFGVDRERGYLLLEDLGDALLLPALTPATVDACYAQAMDLLVALATAPCGELPPYDDAALQAELELFPVWFCDQLLGVPFDAVARERFQALSARLLASAGAQPRVPVHRDFHSRNLLITPEGLATIDFQDALCGPVTYDLVSLLRDCYCRWPDDAVYRWARTFHGELAARGLPGLPDVEGFLVTFDLMGLQRHLKVLGIFARLSLRDGKDGYLGDLPRVYGYVRDVLAAHPGEPALAAFAAWLDAGIAPRLPAQPWWSAP